MPPPKRAAAAAAVVADQGAAAAAALAAARPPLLNNRNNQNNQNNNKRPRRARASPPPPSSPPLSSSAASSPPPPLPFAHVTAPPSPLCPRTVPLALAHLRAADPRLAPLIDAHGQRCAERLGGSTPAAAASQQQQPPTFPRLVQTILAQQLSWKAASTIHKRLLVSAGVLTGVDKEQAGGEYERAALRLTPTHLLSLPDPQIRSAGVSGAKAAALRDLAERYSDGRLSDAMLRDAATAAPEGLNAALSAGASCRSCPGAQAANALLAVKGVGPWSLDMVSMFVLGAPDVLPAGDLGVRKGLARLQGQGGGGGTKKKKKGGSSSSSSSSSSLPDAAAAARIAAAWRPYRTVGSWLMWRLAEERGR